MHVIHKSSRNNNLLQLAPSMKRIIQSTDFLTNVNMISGKELMIYSQYPAFKFVNKLKFDVTSTPEMIHHILSKVDLLQELEFTTENINYDDPYYNYIKYLENNNLLDDINIRAISNISVIKIISGKSTPNNVNFFMSRISSPKKIYLDVRKNIHLYTPSLLKSWFKNYEEGYFTLKTGCENFFSEVEDAAIPYGILNFIYLSLPLDYYLVYYKSIKNSIELKLTAYNDAKFINKNIIINFPNLRQLFFYYYSDKNYVIGNNFIIKSIDILEKLSLTANITLSDEAIFSNLNELIIYNNETVGDIILDDNTYEFNYVGFDINKFPMLETFEINGETSLLYPYQNFMLNVKNLVFQSTKKSKELIISPLLYKAKNIITIKNYEKISYINQTVLTDIWGIKSENINFIVNRSNGKIISEIPLHFFANNKIIKDIFGKYILPYKTGFVVLPEILDTFTFDSSYRASISINNITKNIIVTDSYANTIQKLNTNTVEHIIMSYPAMTIMNLSDYKSLIDLTIKHGYIKRGIPGQMSFLIDCIPAKLRSLEIILDDAIDKNSNTITRNLYISNGLMHNLNNHLNLTNIILQGLINARNFKIQYLPPNLELLKISECMSNNMHLDIKYFPNTLKHFEIRNCPLLSGNINATIPDKCKVFNIIRTNLLLELYLNGNIGYDIGIRSLVLVENKPHCFIKGTIKEGNLMGKEIEIIIIGVFAGHLILKQITSSSRIAVMISDHSLRRGRDVIEKQLKIDYLSQDYFNDKILYNNPELEYITCFANLQFLSNFSLEKYFKTANTRKILYASVDTREKYYKVIENLNNNFEFDRTVFYDSVVNWIIFTPSIKQYHNILPLPIFPN